MTTGGTRGDVLQDQRQEPDPHHPDTLEHATLFPDTRELETLFLDTLEHATLFLDTLEPAT